VEITIIGSGTGVPSLRRSSPCVVVRTGESVLLLDSGPGSLRKMLKADISYSEITAAHYTHTHVDHVNDLAQLLFVSKYGEDMRTRPLTITGPQGFNDFYKHLLALYGDQIISDKYKLTVEEFGSGERLFTDYKLTTRPMHHMVPSLGYRIEDQSGASVVYTGDTDYCDALLELAAEAGVLVIEAALPPGKDFGGHLEPEAAGRIAADSQVGMLVITHLYPVCDSYDTEAEVRKSYQGPLVVAEDLLRFEI